MNVDRPWMIVQPGLPGRTFELESDVNTAGETLLHQGEPFALFTWGDEDDKWIPVQEWDAGQAKGWAALLAANFSPASWREAEAPYVELAGAEVAFSIDHGVLAIEVSGGVADPGVLTEVAGGIQVLLTVDGDAVYDSGEAGR